MDEVWNAVRADYTDESGNRQITAWYTEPESVALFGTREMILDERYVSDEEASAAAQAFLAARAWPEPVVVAVDSRQAPGLAVRALGYGATANFQYVNTAAADGATGNVSDFVSLIRQYDCEFLLAGNIETNTLQRYRRFDRLIRGWDGLVELARMGDATNAPWLVRVGNERRLHYEQADATPTLYWHGPRRGVEGGTGAINGWLVKPGVMRDMTSNATSARPGGFLEQARDFVVEEVEMAEGQARPVFRPAGFDALEILRARDRYLDWMEQVQDG
jgi:hypothetical protein